MDAHLDMNDMRDFYWRSRADSLVYFLYLVLISFVTALRCGGETIQWTNSGNGNWNVPANWSPNRVPTTNDTAVITNSGTYTVALNGYTAIAGLVLGGDNGPQTLSTAGQVLALNGSGSVGSHGVFRLSLGSLSGTNQMQVTGTVLWDGGTIDTNAAVIIARDGQMLIGPGANYVRILHGGVTNEGTITWRISGGLALGGVLRNSSGGLFDVQWAAPIARYGVNPRIVNDGVFRKSLAAGSLDCSVPLVNNATVDVQTGAFNLGGDSVFNSGCQFIGAGETRMDNGTNMINGHIHSGNLALLYSATLTGTGSLSGTLNWGGGNLGHDAAITIATDGTLLIGSGANYTKFLYGNLSNAGQIIFQPVGGLVIGGRLHNPGLFDARGDLPVARLGNGMIVNDGVIRKSAGAGTLDCSVPLINNGTVDTQTGRLSLAGDSVFNSGCRFIGMGEAWMNSGTNTLDGHINSDNLFLLYSATLTGTGSLSGTLNWGGGNLGPGAAITIAADGTLLIGSGANYTKFLYGNLTNVGTIIWRPTGGLAISGALHNAGLFDAQVSSHISDLGGGAVILNHGTFQKSVAVGGTACEISFVNYGTVRVDSGTLEFSGDYANPGGTILLASGTFRTVQPLWLASGLLTGWGTVWGDVTNGASIRPALSNGVLTINGRLTQLLNGSVEFDLAGNTPGTNQSWLKVTGAARLRGTIGVRLGEGYLPEPATSFPVMTFASRSGNFTCFNGFILLGQGRRLTTLYSPTALTLATVAAPEPAFVPLRVAVDDAAMVCWPTEFVGYELYYNTNLNLTNWILIPGATSRYIDPPPLPPQKYFRLLRP